MPDSVTDFLQSQPSPTRRRGGRRRWLPAAAIIAVIAVYLFATRSVSNPGWTTNYQTAVAESEATGRPLLVAFHARGCPPCAMMDRLVFSEPIVRSALKNYVPVRIDIDKHPDIAAKFRVDATPTYAMVDVKGNDVAQTTGYTDVDGFLRFLKEGSKKLAQDGQKAGPPRADAPKDNS